MASQPQQAEPKLLLICQAMPIKEQPHHPLFRQFAAAAQQTHLLLIGHALQLQGQVLQLGPHFRHLHDLVDGGTLHTGCGAEGRAGGSAGGSAAPLRMAVAEQAHVLLSNPTHQPRLSLKCNPEHHVQRQRKPALAFAGSRCSITSTSLRRSRE